MLRDARLPTRRRGAYPVAMPSAAKRWTVDDLASLPDDGNRYEIIDGELLVTPAPSWRHQRIVGALYRRIAAYLEEHHFGDILMAPADVVFARDTVVEPDLLVVPLVDGRKPKAWSDVGRLLLAVEALSPSSMRQDRYKKRPRYQKEQVPECWIVDGDARIVERWKSLKCS
ncbi:MAG TPA: Uma2 family endonuclease [Gemmatimonadaceae bacterium]|nr:Uma2 family endonuclease [Gemmatimonadaceae bacterium]